MGNKLMESRKNNYLQTRHQVFVVGGKFSKKLKSDQPIQWGASTANGAGKTGPLTDNLPAFYINNINGYEQACNQLGTPGKRRVF